MRIWDINPGYLNRQSLLGEHRELHGIVSIILNQNKGYSNHPETRRWIGYGWALKKRHDLLSCEMALRGYTDKSPVKTSSNKGNWPTRFVDDPGIQFQLLEKKYRRKEKGRIPLPKNEQVLWSHHKYSVLARDQNKYKEIGRAVSKQEIDFHTLSLLLVEILRIQPGNGGIRNAIQHMWGYVSEINEQNRRNVESWSLQQLLYATQKITMEANEPYITKSTALSELMAWI